MAEAYLNVLRAGEALKVANQLVEALAAHQRDVGQFFSKGLVARSDVLAVEVALADARQKAYPGPPPSAWAAAPITACWRGRCPPRSAWMG